MHIAGIVKTSLLDYPGKISAVIFTQGCNYNCFYCHNRALIEPVRTDVTTQTSGDISAFLHSRIGKLDGIVLSGGEPTLHKSIGVFLSQIKDMGYAVKIDTNGSNPDCIETLLSRGLVDYIALDVKAPYARYNEITGALPIGIEQTLTLLRAYACQYEVRTTYIPQLNNDDIATIARTITPVPLYILQPYRIPELYLPDDADRVNTMPHNNQALEEAAAAARGYVDNVRVRG